MDLRMFQDGTLRDPNGMIHGRIASPLPLDRVHGTVPCPVAVPERTPEDLRAKVLALKELPQPAQRSEAWLRQRSTRITASEVGAVLGESGYETALDVLLKKVGAAAPFSGNRFTLWGQKYEPVAQALYEMNTGRELLEFGLLLHQKIPFLGASPDGICTDGRMLEIKCPSTRVIDGNIPRHYYLQMQLQLEVCDLEVCDFEECRFAEYESAEEFLADQDDSNPGRSRRSGLACGILLERNDGKDVQHAYMPRFGMTVAELNDWVSERQTQDARFKPVYWRLDQYSCVEVLRDRAWFQKALPVLEHFWYQVSFYRNNGLETLIPLIPNTRKYADVLKRLAPGKVDASRGPRIKYLTDSESEDEIEVDSASSDSDDGMEGADFLDQIPIM